MSGDFGVLKTGHFLDITSGVIIKKEKVCKARAGDILILPQKSQSSALSQQNWETYQTIVLLL